MSTFDDVHIDRVSVSHIDRISVSHIDRVSVSHIPYRAARGAGPQRLSIAASAASGAFCRVTVCAAGAAGLDAGDLERARAAVKDAAKVP